MTLAEAQRHAANLIPWLAPHCESLAVAGSVRRCRATVNDIDIVAIPRTVPIKDLLGVVTLERNILWEELCHYAEDSKGRVRILSGSKTPGEIISLLSPKYQLDVFFATPETFTSILICRTGSREHNIWLADRAEELYMHWTPNKGLYSRLHPAGDQVPNPRIETPTEEAFYGVLKLRFIAPENREQSWIHRHLEFGLKV